MLFVGVLFQMAQISQVDTVMFCAQRCYLIGVVPAFWHPGGPFLVCRDDFGTSGHPWRAMGAAGWTRGGGLQDFV